MTRIISDGPGGSQVTTMGALSDAALAGYVRDSHPEAIREFWRRKLRPAWASRIGEKMGRRHGA